MGWVLGSRANSSRTMSSTRRLKAWATLKTFCLTMEILMTSEVSMEGTWEGILSYQSAQGLYNPGWSADCWRFIISSGVAKVFMKRDNGAFHEVKPGKYKLQIFMANALITAIDSGDDKDGTWVETEAFILTQVDGNKLGAILAGAVNNIDVPTDQITSKFFYTATGEMLRQN